jgi:hypothetical protein
MDMRMIRIHEPRLGPVAVAVAVVVAVGTLLAPLPAVGQVSRASARVAPELPLGSTEFVKVEDHRSDDYFEVVVGPVALPEGGAHVRLPIQMISMPVDGWLHGYEIVMTDGDGNELPSRLLHHINFIDPNHRELFAEIPRRIMAAGQETPNESMPWFLGYPIDADQPIIVSAMFGNEYAADYPEVYARVRFDYSREGEGLFDPWFDVYPFYLDVMGPVGLKDFPLPPGQTTMSWEGTPAVDGRILALGGHLHDYADEIRLEDVTTGEILWRAEPVVNETGQTVSVPVSKLWWRLGIKLQADHTYRIAVDYTNPTENTIGGGGMGAIGGVAWIPRDTEWPTLDKTNPVYIADLTNTLEAPEKLAHGHGGHQGAGSDMDTGMNTMQSAPVDAAADGGHGHEAEKATHEDHSGHMSQPADEAAASDGGEPGEALSGN